MKIGIVSDSHGDRARLSAAVDLLAAQGAQVIVHCGDIGSPGCVQALAEAGLPVYLIVGNMDRHPQRLVAMARSMGMTASWEVIRVPIDGGRSLAVTHGNDAAVLNELIASGQFAYVLHGHTHRFRDERLGPTRVINPGALRHCRDGGTATAALLDTQTDTVRRLGVDPDRAPGGADPSGRP